MARAWGREGPRNLRRGFDTIVQTAMGMAMVSGRVSLAGTGRWIVDRGLVDRAALAEVPMICPLKKLISFECADVYLQISKASVGSRLCRCLRYAFATMIWQSGHSSLSRTDFAAPRGVDNLDGRLGALALAALKQ